MDLFGVGSLVSGIANMAGQLGSTGINAATNSAINEAQIKMQKQIAADQIKAQREFNQMQIDAQTAWNQQARDWQLEDRDYVAGREDSEAQRRAKDLEAAGINPLLAGNDTLAGTGMPGIAGGTGPAMGHAQPQPAQAAALRATNVNLQLGEAFEKIADAAASAKERAAKLANTEAETGLKQSETIKKEQETRELEIENQYKEQQVELQLQKAVLENTSLETTVKQIVQKMGLDLSRNEREQAELQIKKELAQQDITSQRWDDMIKDDEQRRKNKETNAELELQKERLDTEKKGKVAEIAAKMIGTVAGTVMSVLFLRKGTKAASAASGATKAARAARRAKKLDALRNLE